MTEKLTERDYEVLDACCELLSMKIDELKAENDRLNKILQEIKKIAENREIFCDNCSVCCDCDECTCDEFTCDDCGYVKILQKLTKAESEG